MLWVCLCVSAGSAFGNVPIIKNNFSLVALGIVGVPLVPVVVQWWRERSGSRPGQR